MRSNAFSIGLVLAINLAVVLLISGCKEGYVRPDPMLCQPMIKMVAATLADGTVAEVIDPNSYWFCAKRSDPYNEAFHKRPRFVDFINNETPTAVSSDDLVKLNQAEEDADKYIKQLEADCRK